MCRYLGMYRIYVADPFACAVVRGGGWSVAGRHVRSPRYVAGWSGPASRAESCRRRRLWRPVGTAAACNYLQRVRQTALASPEWRRLPRSWLYVDT